eukprot:692962-Prymnesium_polylepis.1
MAVRRTLVLAQGSTSAPRSAPTPPGLRARRYAAQRRAGSARPVSCATSAPSWEAAGNPPVLASTAAGAPAVLLSLIHISEPTRRS